MNKHLKKVDAARQLVIDRIEGYTGSLLSMPWNELSSNDLYELGLAIFVPHKPHSAFPILNALDILKEEKP